MEWSELFNDFETLSKIIEASTKKFLDSNESKSDDVARVQTNQLFMEAYQLSDGKIIDLTKKSKFLYASSDQIEHFVGIDAAPDFSGLEEFIQQYVHDVPEIIVDYGCGNALKSSYIRFLLQERDNNKKHKIHLVDFNRGVLSVASQIATRLDLKTKGYDPFNDEAVELHMPSVVYPEEDTISLEKYKIIRDDQQKRFHLFLGQTLGNFEDPEAVVKNLAESMVVGEYILVEWYQRDSSTYQTGEFGERTKQGILNLIRNSGISQDVLDMQNPDGFVKMEIDAQGREWNLGYFTLKQNFRHGTGKWLEEGTELVGLRSRRFRDEDVIRIFEEQGLKVQTLENTIQQELKWFEAGDARYALFKRTRDYKPLRKAALSSLAIAALAAGVTTSLISGPIVCENAKMDFMDVVCTIDEKENSFPLYEIADPQFEKDQIEGTVAGTPYKFEFSSADGLTQATQALTKAKEIFLRRAKPATCKQRDDKHRVGELIRKEYKLSDPDGHSVKVDSLELPRGATGRYIDRHSYEIRWVPTAEQIGPNQIKLTISDGHGGSNVYSETIDVASNRTLVKLDEAYKLISDCGDDLGLLAESILLSQTAIRVDQKVNSTLLNKIFENTGRGKDPNRIKRFIRMASKPDILSSLQAIAQVDPVSQKIEGPLYQAHDNFYLPGLLYRTGKNIKIQFNPFFIEPAVDFLWKLSQSSNGNLTKHGEIFLRNTAQRAFDKSVSELLLFAVANDIAKYVNSPNLGMALHIPNLIAGTGKAVETLMKLGGTMRAASLDPNVNKQLNKSGFHLYRAFHLHKEKSGTIPLRVEQTFNIAQDLYRQKEANVNYQEGGWFNVTIAYAHVLHQPCVFHWIENLRALTPNRTNNHELHKYNHKVIRAIVDSGITQQGNLTKDVLNQVKIDRFIGQYQLCEDSSLSAGK